MPRGIPNKWLHLSKSHRRMLFIKRWRKNKNKTRKVIS